MASDNHTRIYSTSKFLAYQASQDFMRTQKPDFTLISIMPSFVLGRHALATSTSALISSACTNSILMTPLLGHSIPFPIPGTTIHVADVARVHIESLVPAIEGNQDFILSAGGILGVQWDDAVRIVRRIYEREVKDGKLPLGGSVETKLVKVDANKAERTFGFSYKTFEEQVIDVVGQYLELLGREEGGSA